MDITLLPSTPNGTINAISSKSAAHRILICAAFSDGETVIRCDRTNKDIDSTVNCLNSLGASISYTAPYFHVTPISTPKQNAVLDCGESGSTLRFLLPIIPAIGVSASFLMHGRLPERPLEPLYSELMRHGASLSPEGSNPLMSSGRLSTGEYRIRGDVSSQFISGLLFALSVSGLGGRIIIEGVTESAPYIQMTLDALSLFGVHIQKTNDGYTVPEKARLVSPRQLTVEGDWSNSAFLLCMGALGGGTVAVSGLDANSAQGDRAIVDLLRAFGADVTENENKYTVRGGRPLHGIDIDASQIPDLVPVLAVVASLAEGETRIYGASRLRLKESDRIASVYAMLASLGATVKETQDGLTVTGNARLAGGMVDTVNDHRIAMSAAVASVACTDKVVIKSAECTAKSYPDFWTDIKTHLCI